MRAELLRFGKRLGAAFGTDDVPGIAAEIAYRFLFAVFPFGIFVAALTAFIAEWLGIDNPTGMMLSALGDNLPGGIASELRDQLEVVIGETQPGLLTVGALGALWAATGGTNALIKAMNRAFDVEETRSFVVKTAIAVGGTLLAGFGLLAAFVTIVGTSLITDQVARRLGLEGGALTAIQLIRWPVVFAFVALSVGLLFRLAPNTRPPWRWCIGGGALFAFGWLVATGGFALYAANFADYSNTYGALGGVIVLMLWFYLTALVLLGSAELIAVGLAEFQPEALAALRRENATSIRIDAERSRRAADSADEVLADFRQRRGAVERPVIEPGPLERPAIGSRPSAARARAAGPRRAGRAEPRRAGSNGADVLVAGGVAAMGLALGGIAAWALGRVTDGPPARHRSR